MAVNDRFNGVEGETIRLFFRNYVSNVLTDASSLPTVQIRPTNISTILATPTVVRQSRGVYYVDWAVPSSDVESPKFDGDFPGPGFYQDVWTADGDTFAQDFFIFSQQQLSDKLNVIEPIRFEYSLLTPRLSQGARDFVTIRVNETNGRLTAEEDIFPEGDIRFFFGDQVIFNYTPLLHRSTSNEYKFFLDTVPLQVGSYRIQTRHTIPAGIVDERATFLSTRSLANGFSPNGTALLDMTVDGIKRVVSFPTTATAAKITTTIPSSLEFRGSANDLFITTVDGTQRERRLLNGTNPRTIEDIVDDLNGTFPSAAFGTTFTLPAITSSIDVTTAKALQAEDRELTFEVDGTTYSVTFNNIVNENDIVTQINNQRANTALLDGARLILSPSGATSIRIISGDAAPILGFVNGQDDNDRFGLKLTSGADQVAVIGIFVTATANPADNDTLDVGAQTFTFKNTPVATNDIQIAASAEDTLANLKSKIDSLYSATFKTKFNQDETSLTIINADRTNLTLSATPTGFDVIKNINIVGDSKVRIQQPVEGSVANDSLGFLPSGEEATAQAAQPSSISGNNVFPIVSQNPTSATVVSNSEPTFDPLAFGGKTLDFEIDNSGTTNVVFTDSLLPPAITSTFTVGSFEITDGGNDVLVIEYSRNQDDGSPDTTTINVDLTSSGGTETLSLAEVIQRVNAAINVVTDVQSGVDLASKYIVADNFNGHLRIRAKQVFNSTGIAEDTDGFVQIVESSSTALTILGFNGVVSNPEEFFQNDQLVDTGPEIRAYNYIEPFTLSRAVSQINSQHGSSVASIANGLLQIKSPTQGTSSEVEIIGGTAVSDLNLPTGTFNGLDGSKYDIEINVNGTGFQQVTFENGINSASDIVNFINGELPNLVVASINSNGGITIQDAVAGSGRTLEIRNSDSDLTVLGFSSAGPISVTNGTDRVPAIVFSTETPETTYVSTGNGILKIRDNATGAFVTVNLTGITTGSGVASAINSSAAGTGGGGDIQATFINPTLELTTPLIFGEDSIIQIGGLNDGSTANAPLNLNIQGVRSTGTPGTPYSIDQIVDRVNAAFGGESILLDSGNFLRFQSIEQGAQAEIVVEQGTTNDIISAWGISKGTFVGESRTQAAQTIVSPRITFIIGE